MPLPSKTIRFSYIIKINARIVSAINTLCSPLSWGIVQYLAQHGLLVISSDKDVHDQEGIKLPKEYPDLRKKTFWENHFSNVSSI